MLRHSPYLFRKYDDRRCRWQVVLDNFLDWEYCKDSQVDNVQK